MDIDQPTRYTYEESDSDLEASEEASTFPPPILLLSPTKLLDKGSSESTSQSKKLISGRVLLLGVQGGGNLFLSAIENKKLIGALVLPKVDSDQNVPENSKSDHSFFLYELEDDPGVIIVPCNYQVEDQRAAAWTKALFKHIAVKSIVIFDTFSSSSYIIRNRQEEDSPYPPFVRILQTTSASPIESIPLYQPPNLVRNLAAAVLAYCELRKIPAYSLLSLLDSHHGKTEATVQTLQAHQTAWESLVKTMGTEIYPRFNVNFSNLFNKRGESTQNVTGSSLYL